MKIGFGEDTLVKDAGTRPLKLRGGAMALTIFASIVSPAFAQSSGAERQERIDELGVELELRRSEYEEDRDLRVGEISEWAERERERGADTWRVDQGLIAAIDSQRYRIALNCQYDPRAVRSTVPSGPELLADFNHLFRRVLVTSDNREILAEGQAEYGDACRDVHGLSREYQREILPLLVELNRLTDQEAADRSGE